MDGLLEYYIDYAVTAMQRYKPYLDNLRNLALLVFAAMVLLLMRVTMVRRMNLARHRIEHKFTVLDFDLPRQGMEQ